MTSEKQVFGGRRLAHGFFPAGLPFVFRVIACDALCRGHAAVSRPWTVHLAAVSGARELGGEAPGTVSGVGTLSGRRVEAKNPPFEGDLSHFVFWAGS